jgi:Fe-S-cluster containining protein
VLTRRDVTRLAKYLNLTFEVCERRHTRRAYGHKWLMRRQKDQHFGMICRFFDTEKRRCTVYQGRPGVCRQFPGKGRCGYYDFLMFERRAQNDPEFVAVTTHK